MPATACPHDQVPSSPDGCKTQNKLSRETCNNISAPQASILLPTPRLTTEGRAARDRESAFAGKPCDDTEMACKRGDGKLRDPEVVTEEATCVRPDSPAAPSNGRQASRTEDVGPPCGQQTGQHTWGPKEAP